MPRFDSKDLTIVNSSLWTCADDVIKVFMTMLMERSPDDVYRGDGVSVGKLVYKDEAVVNDILYDLCQPDEFGRVRLKQVPGG